MVISRPDEPIYPHTDGKPMAENTIQYRWITTIKGGMDAIFRDDPDVFIAGDLFWYPVRGEPEIRTAPDVLMVFGRPKGDRLSYLQWRENDIPPQVVFEVLSPSNTTSEMAAKLEWYEQYGVEEYYVYDPDHCRLQGWLRKGDTLRGIPNIREGFISPRTKVHFKLEDELVLTGPDGRKFVDYPELAAERDSLAEAAQAAAQQAEFERLRAEKEFARAEREQMERQAADQRAQREQTERQAAELRAQREQTERQAAELRAQREQTERELAERRAEHAETELDEIERSRREDLERSETARRQAEEERDRLRALLRARGIDPDTLS